MANRSHSGRVKRLWRPLCLLLAFSLLCTNVRCKEDEGMSFKSRLKRSASWLPLFSALGSSLGSTSSQSQSQPSSSSSSSSSRRVSDISDDTGHISFSIPLLRDLGFPQPVAVPIPSFGEYLSKKIQSRIDTGLDTVQHSVIPAIGGAIETMEPVVRESAKHWRHTVDHHIAPAVRAGLVSMGETTVKGMQAGVDMLAVAMMGSEAKEETFEAISTLAKAVMGNEVKDHLEPPAPDYDYGDLDYTPYAFTTFIQTDDNSETYSEPANVYYYGTVDSPEQQFVYQQLDPAMFAESVRPPPLNTHSIEDPRTDENPVYAFQVDPRHHQEPHPVEYDYYDLPEDPESSALRDSRQISRKVESGVPPNGQSVEQALYVLGKHILGRNLTDRIYPVAKQVAVGFGQVGEGLETIGGVFPSPTEIIQDFATADSASDAAAASTNPVNDDYSTYDYYYDQGGYLAQPSTGVEFDSAGVRVKTIEDLSPAASSNAPNGERNAGTSTTSSSSNTDNRVATAPRCTTPQGGSGKCMDIQHCPLLLADLNMLRKSICFKSLFVPGVCCPSAGVQLVALDDKLNLVNEVQEVPVVLPQGTTASPVTLPEASTRRPPLPPPGPTNSPSRPFPRPPSSLRPNVVPGTSLECGRNKIPQARIVGGNATYEGEYPWMVAIYLHGNGRREFWCGGALVSPTHVVTAAHCTRDAKKKPFRPTQFTVRVGEWDLHDSDSYSEEFRVIDYVAHPNFKPNGFYNDVAVFKLDTPVQFSAHIQPICLPLGANLRRTFVNTLPVALGWGTTHYGGDEVSRLRGVPLPVWNNQDCDDAYFQPITEVFMCAGYADGGRDACQGDSGGPLMLYDEEAQSWTLIGIVSFGNRCAEPGYPGVYTRLTYFMDFVLSAMAT